MFNFEVLETIPGLEQNDTGTFQYSEEIRNKIFIYRDQYIHFNENDYDMYPRNLLDVLIEHSGLLANARINNNGNDDSETSIDWERIENEINNIFQSKSIEIQKYLISYCNSYIEDKLKALPTQPISSSISQSNDIEPKLNFLHEELQKFSKSIDHLNDEMLQIKIKIEQMNNEMNGLKFKNKQTPITSESVYSTSITSFNGINKEGVIESIKSGATLSDAIVLQLISN